jgi:transcriptional regulator GlxA family with amidase domain
MPALRNVVIVAFDDTQALDVIGPAEVFGMAARHGGADYAVSIVTPGGTPARTTSGARIEADGDLHTLRTPIDTLIVAGGDGTRVLERDDALVARIATLAAKSRRVTSVCTGALLLAAAGLLDGLDATTHWVARDLLKDLGAHPVPQRVVVQGKIVTAAGVSAGIDMALMLAAKVAGEQVAQAIQLGIEYDPQPPFDTGALEKASPELVTVLRGLADAEEASAAHT